MCHLLSHFAPCVVTLRTGKLLGTQCQLINHTIVLQNQFANLIFRFPLYLFVRTPKLYLTNITLHQLQRTSDISRKNYGNNYGNNYNKEINTQKSNHKIGNLLIYILLLCKIWNINIGYSVTYIVTQRHIRRQVRLLSDGFVVHKNCLSIGTQFQKGFRIDTPRN